MVFKHPTFHREDPVVEQEFPPQAMLETSVAAALASAGGLDATNVTVTAKGPVIELGGRVFLKGEIRRAEEVARSVPGVSKVVNDLIAEQP
ncbi:BON domain-containing protein [Rhizobium helianthi]|uniref:BON domain-containing protein n=1 Tax=Rhizobium helianthi TaxID=1132695 RepID=A0ABW4M6G9_9HYPH